MNFQSLLERMWQEVGMPSSGDARPDWRLQTFKDALAEANDEISRICPFMFQLIRESTLSITPSTTDYALDDWCRYPISFWTQTDNAHKINLRVPRLADYDGSRSPSYVSWAEGPYDFVPLPRSTAAFATLTGLTVTENSATVNTASAAATWVNRAVKFAGQDEDYKISSVSVGVSFTMDKVYKGRLTGVGTAGTGTTAVTTASISPVGNYVVRVQGGVANAMTIYYRYVTIPRRMIVDADRPEMPEAYHNLIWKRALKNVAATNEDNNAWSRWSADYERELELLKASEQDMQDSEEVPRIDSTLDGHRHPRGPMDADYGRWNMRW